MINPSNPPDDLLQIRLRQIIETDNRQLVVHVSLDGTMEPLPRTAVVNEPMAAHIDYKPAKPVGARFPIVESDGRPHLVEAGSLKKLLRVQRVVPLGEVIDREIQGAVCRG